MVVRLQKDAFDVGEELRLLQDQPFDTPIGAMASFTGLVRNDTPENPLIALELECFNAMCLKTLQTLETQAITRWNLPACLIIHRYGRLSVGEPIMMVATLSAHRKQAFDAATFLMDYLKTRAPFWKKEHFATGTRWVEALIADESALKNWD